jgi:hypothetical protein
VTVVIVLGVAPTSAAPVIEPTVMVMAVTVRDRLQVHADAAEKTPLVAARGSATR